MKSSHRRNRQTCPRRMSEFGPWDRVENKDRWSRHHGFVGSNEPTCTFCGSLRPDRFIELVEAGYVVGPTDKNYKAYLDDQQGGSRVGKFYYQHLDRDQRQRFIELANTGQMKIGYPGHFYVLPFFCKVDD